MEDKQLFRKLKRIVRDELKKEYGFTVSKLYEITLLESSDDGNYILFQVENHEYELHRNSDRSYNDGIIQIK